MLPIVEHDYTHGYKMMMENTKSIIETERLRLRNWQDQDFIPFQKINADQTVMEYYPSTLDASETYLLIERIQNHFIQWGYGLYAVEYKENNEFIGFTGLSHPRFQNDFTPCVEIGWRLDKNYWNKGLATEAAKAVLHYAFHSLDLDKIYSFTALSNTPSKRVMQKIGMTELGTFYHPNIDIQHPLCEHWLYKIDQIDYLSNQ